MGNTTNYRSAVNHRFCGARKSACGFRGVHRCGSSFVASIAVDCVLTRLGSFPTKELAATAYDVAAIGMYSGLAVTNFPKQRYPNAAKEWKELLWLRSARRQVSALKRLVEQLDRDA